MAPRRTVDGNRSRRRAREEVESLREKVAQLEDELARLRDAGGAALGKRRAIAEMEREETMEATWRRIALQQRELRFESEVENTRLREAMESRVRVATELERLCKKSEVALRREFGCGGAPDVEDAGSKCSVQSCVVLHMLKSSLPGLLSRSQEVFGLEKFTVNSRAFRHVDLKSTVEHGTFVETYGREFLPFDVHSTTEAIMHTFGARDTSASEADDDVVTDYRMVVGTSRFQGSVKSKVAVRQRFEDGATIIAFTSLSEPYCCDDFDGIHTRCFGWKRVRALSVYSDPSRPLTEIVTYFQVIPEVYTFVRDQNRKITALNTFLKATIGCQMDFWSNALDNRLLDRALKRRRN